MRNSGRRKNSELYVITKAKDLSSYIFQITYNSPKKFRFTFVSRLQNVSIDIVEDLFRANMIYVKDRDDLENIARRKKYQKEAYVSLKLLGLLSQAARESGCILPKQYEIISEQSAGVTLLLIKWGRSDQARYNKKG